LQHIITHYAQQSAELADYTMFLHTQPAHHLAIDRFLRFLIYMSTCSDIITSTSSTATSRNNNNNTNSVSNNNNNLFPGKLEYVNLNYRWLSGSWAHQPEK
jgi:hypothetical protein